MTRPLACLRAMLLLTLLGLFALPALAGSTLTWTPGMIVTRLSADGSVGAGNSTDGTYSPSRWTSLEGVVRLGQSSGELFGRGAGTPGISADGNQISSTIASLDTTVVTQGRWTKGLGWEQTMPPLPPGGRIVDESVGSAWGISGDGSTVVGFAWHEGARAYCSAWTAEGGLTILGSQDPDYDSRGNDANMDGSVVVGWSSIGFGFWQPTVWEDGVLTVLHASERWCEAKAVNPTGDIVVGVALDTLTDINSAAMWVKNGGTWDEYILGALPGTFGAGVGNVYGLDLNADGSRVVGANKPDNWTSKGFVWDPTQGIVEASDWLADFGIAFPDSYLVYEMTAISDDGSTMAGIAYNTYDYPFTYEGFIVNLEEVSPVPPARAAGLELGPAHPNPFNPSTSFALTLPRSGRVTLDICDLRGRVIRNLHDGEMAGGHHSVEWNGRLSDGRIAPSGMYLARARDARGFEQTRRMMLVK